jgi:hypothetical protein
MESNSKIRQIDYTTPRTLVAYSGRRVVRLTGEETRYKFSGVLIEGVENDFAKIGEERNDWQKSAFPLPWTDSPERVEFVPDTQ